MPFNPCGFKVQYLREEGTDLIRPFFDSDMLITRRWFRAAEDAPWLPFPTVFRSTRWEPFPYLRAGAGAEFPSDWAHKRVGVVQGFDYAHFCGTEADFQGGASLDPDRNVVYDDEWIPECCGRESVCVTQLCSQDQENARPAAQLRSYPVPHQDATDETTVAIQRWQSRAVPGDPSWPGYGFEWWPAGEAGARALAHQVVADETGQLQYQYNEWALPGGLVMSETRDASGLTLLLDNGTDAGTLTVRINGGKLELCGTNAIICDGILPPYAPALTSGSITCLGTTQAGATPMTFSLNQIISGNANRGARLPATPLTQHLKFANQFGSTGFKIYPASGDRINALAVDAPFVVTTAELTGHVFTWCADGYDFGDGHVTWLVYKSGTVI